MKPSIKYFIYIRKSTDDKKGRRQAMSLDAQMRALRALVKKDKLVVVSAFEESRTAKEPGRPKFNRMLDRIERGEANGILAWDIDRLYRNPIDEGRTRWMLQKNIIASIKTPTRSYFPADAGLLMAVEGGRATDFIIHHMRDVSRGIEEKLWRGEWPGQRPLGYLYDHTLRNIVPDPEKVKIVQTIFQEASEGTHGLVWLSDRLVSLGITTKNNGRWAKYQVYRMLTNRLYIGIMSWNGQTFEGKFKPIITQELFNKVQKALKIRSKPRRKKEGHHFPYCGLFHCSCGSMMTAQWAKGHGGLYRYYRCTRKAGPCKEPYLQEKFLTQQCLDLLQPLTISTEQADYARSLIDKKTENESQTVEKDLEKITEKLYAVQDKLNRLTHLYLNEKIEEESYASANADLITEKTALKQEKQRLHRTGSSYWNEPANEVVNALELAGKMQKTKSPAEISQLVRKTGTNLLLSGKTVSFNFAAPYDLVPSFLGKMPVVVINKPSLGDEKNPSGYQLLQMCRLVDYLRTHFSKKTDFDQEEV
jgi:DNA invertase Pin-like site-specific DNA recombinase